MPTNLTASSAAFTRRRLRNLPAVAASARRLPTPSPAGTCAPRHLVDRALAEPVARAYHYLDVVQDAYVKGGEPRLLQSYNNESELLTTAFVYDNALAALAYLANPTVANVRRARLIGDALLWVQAHDERYADGRVRQAYAAGPMRFYGDGPAFPGLRREGGRAAHLWPFGFGGSSTGDMAWAALALAQLYVDTRIAKYLDGTVALGLWIAGQESGHRHGGYHGGRQADGETPERWASTEHNVDAYALFALLAKLTRDRAWTARADVAAAFVRRMWNPAGRHFWTGTGEDPEVINTGNVPEDVQSWGLLGLGEDRYDAAVDWVTTHLANTDGPVSGVTYSSQAKVVTDPVSGSALPSNPHAVWLEGTAHTALALLKRGRTGDAGRARQLLQALVTAQETLGAGQTVGRTGDPHGGRLANPGEGGTWTGAPLPAASGIVAATSAFETGFGFGYFGRQHVGTTAWFLMAAQNFNPYQ
ncbi:hypothetical protein [Pseudosporangium ferrugineum]|uniref:Uncharacterized protein n=1 Tax=Pseudosporangium ferrugineum TaxID=439699 RepID=A0A2T0SCW6_9ACTN|nr:hypothetical protein [Pseudosporangium ferrugineum]PRY31265.1 hypothetical protein CLV70_103151 [Pseudosporangium ferrugineum]